MNVQRIDENFIIGWEGEGQRLCRSETHRVPLSSSLQPRQVGLETHSGSLLLLTDSPARSKGLARDLSTLAPCIVSDLLDPELCSVATNPATLRAVISDASLFQSATIAALRRELQPLQARGLPFLCLLREESSRATIQATALGATHILLAAATSQLLRAVSEATNASLAASNKILLGMAAADAALARIFDEGRAGAAIDPALVTAGTQFVEAAVREAGIRDWLEMVWQFDDATHQHCLLVAGLAAGFAQSLGLREADCQRLTQAAVLHDVGKAKIPVSILNKPVALTPEEREIMKQHPAYGHAMLRGSGFSEEMLGVVRWHHEALDGSGYPDGLRGSEIPDLVRLVSVCDVYGALIERRPYREPMSAERAYAILESSIGKLDGDLVRAFKPFAVIVGSP